MILMTVGNVCTWHVHRLVYRREFIVNDADETRMPYIGPTLHYIVKQVSSGSGKYSMNWNRLPAENVVIASKSR